MAISISSRVRNAMIGLSVALCMLFTAVIFLLIYVIEDQVFVNQIKAEKLSYEQSKEPNWRPRNSNMRLVHTSQELPQLLPITLRTNIEQQPGVHEYFDGDNAMFIAHFSKADNGQSYFLIYDVKDLLAVRDSKTQLFVMIGILTLLICIVAIYLAHRLSKKTLSPIRKLTHELQNSDIDDAVIELANEFSADEVGVLAHELALALERVRDGAQREYEFNRGVSHELRSPIQVAQSAAELIELQANASHQQLAKPVQRLKRSVTEMNDIVEAFLWLASDRQASASDTCAVGAIHALFKQYKQMTPSINWEVRSNVPPEFEYKIPESVLVVVVRSLIRNAITHGCGGQVTLALNKKSISLQNATENAGKRTDGFGMGLSIAQRLCDRFNCQLVIDSRKGKPFITTIELV